MTPHHHHHDDDFDRGLAFDLSTIMDRRQVLKLAAGVTLLPLVAAACGSGTGSVATPTASPETTPSETTASTTGDAAPAAENTEISAAGATTCDPIPEEVAGPYPGDGSNGGPNVLMQSGIVRSDIRASFGDASGEAAGVQLTLTMTITDTANGCTPLQGAAVYAWHCDANGDYSMYSEAIVDQNYLRGVQETDANGNVTFTTIFPGCYQGRWPHVHFEVYPSLDAATSAGALLATSQLAFPKDSCDTAYATDGYASSVSNLAGLSLETDNVFSDSVDQQLATVTGSVDEGFTASLVVAV